MSEKQTISKKKYTTPYGINLISQIIKHQNEIIINNYCFQKKLTEKQTQELKKELLKVNNYTPQVIQSKRKEQLQKYLL